ncbi:MAG: hypothetical protein Q7T59_01705, partial [Candidatus Woesebacteria bacterium]|nr:hypothetical protein [Candidatus Woesebacteria bacterium]
ARDPIRKSLDTSNWPGVLSTIWATAKARVAPVVFPDCGQVDVAVQATRLTAPRNTLRRVHSNGYVVISNSGEAKYCQ